MAAIAVRGGIADVAELKRAVPLPETVDELCDVARMLGALERDVWLGARSSEPEIARMSEAGQLRDYRVLQFATHGALAGEAMGSTEPGLLLTPPTHASEGDDGYLSASEIARLKLDADWVILSACNTAAGEAKGAEALSGLARAFFYAWGAGLARLALVRQQRCDGRIDQGSFRRAERRSQNRPCRGPAPLHARTDRQGPRALRPPGQLGAVRPGWRRPHEQVTQSAEGLRPRLGGPAAWQALGKVGRALSTVSECHAPEASLIHP